MPSPFLRSDATLIKIAQEYIDAGFVDIPDDEVVHLIHFGIDMKRLLMIMTKLLKLNKAIEDVKYSPYIGPIDPVISGTLKNEFKELNRKYKKSPLFNVKRPRRGRSVVPPSSGPRRGRSAGPPSSGAGPSSFGTPRYITVNGRKRRLYRGLYGGIYYKNTSGKKIYLNLKPKMKMKMNKIIKSADGISVTGWKNILDFYEKSNHKITWVHSPTRVLKMVKIGDMIEFTVKTDDSGEMYDKYLDIIVSPDDDGNYPVSIDGKKYLVAGNVYDAKNTFSYVHGAPSAFDPGRSWYVYKFKTRINLTEV
jgi:hypothetical protein